MGDTEIAAPLKKRTSGPSYGLGFSDRCPFWPRTNFCVASHAPQIAPRKNCLPAANLEKDHNSATGRRFKF
jgi:hypothetical protein